MKNYLGLLLFCAILFTSCGDREDPSVRFITPANNTEVAPGETVSIQVEATDNEALQTITVGGDVTGLSPITEFDAVDKHNWIFGLRIDEATTSGVELTVNVKATDPDGNEGSEDLILKVN